MKAEIHLFMTTSDVKEFLHQAERLVDAITENGASFLMIIGDCEIVYTPSMLLGETLTAGSIAISSGGIDKGCKQRLKADGIFKKLRKWIKNNYSNRLCTWDEEDADNVSRVREFWIGPDALQRKAADNKLLLRLSSTSSTRYDLAPDMNIMGDITPKVKKKK